MIIKASEMPIDEPDSRVRITQDGNYKLTPSKRSPQLYSIEPLKEGLPEIEGLWTVEQAVREISKYV